MIEEQDWVQSYYIYIYLPIQTGAIIEQGKEENEDTTCSKPVLLLHACIWAA